MRLHAVRLGIAVGIVWAIGILFLGGAAITFDWGKPAVLLLESIYLGFSATALGLLVGVIWGFVDGFIGGFLIGWVYNKLAGLGV